IGNASSAKEQAVANARSALRGALLAGLRSGSIDENALQGKVDALVKARTDASPALRKSLTDLHGLLDSGHRAALADRVAGLMKDVTDASGGWLDALAGDLALTDDQKRKIGDLIAKSKPQLDEERALAGRVFDGFRKDDFDIEAIAPVSGVGDRTRA